MLYHLSFDVFEEVEEFKPRIPKNRIKKEDKKIKRVCCSNSIEGCLLSMPNNSEILLYHKNIYPLIKVYEFNEKDIDEEYLYFPKDINNKVPDVLNTKEHWITSNIGPNNSYIISIKSLKYISETNEIQDLDYRVLNEEETLNISDFYSYKIEAKVSKETDKLIEKFYINSEKDDYDIENKNELMTTFEYIVKDTLSEITDEYTCFSNEGDTHLNLYIDGYYIGDFKERAFIYKYEDVIKKLYHDTFQLTDRYKLDICIS